MNLSTECLEASQVDSLLQGNLTPEEYEAAQNHLELCETCRARVEATIGPEQWWSDVQSVLLNSRTGVFSQRNASSTDAEPNEPSTAKLLDLLGPTDDPNMLGRIGPYEIIGLLGQGGMGVVFKGFDRSLNRFVAIKMLLPHLAASGAARKRFAREGQAVAAVVDDHVMAIHCVDEWQGVPYLVMTYSRGISLQKRLSDNGPLEVREILRIGMQAAKGLAAAHAQGIVHRDIKPANIFLDQSVERVQLMDFGLARAVDDASLTRSGTLAGTPQYMSPEQARAETVDHRSDLFSLGSVMYAMCTGHAPFRAESSYSVLRLITDKEPRPIREINPDVPEWLCSLINKLMAKQACERFDSAKQVADLFESCLAHVQQPTSVSLPASILPHAAGRRLVFNSTQKGMIAMLGTIGMTLLGMVLMQATEAPDISGQWTSDEWGTVVLETKERGQYEGTFTGSDKGKPAYEIVDIPAVTEGGMSTAPVLVRVKSGTVQLKWSRVERRFNGTWRKGVDRSGKMSLRLVDNEIRGAWTTAKDAQKESGTPRLGDLLWTRKTKRDDVDLPTRLENPATETPLDSQNARSVAEAYVAAALAGRVEQAASLAKGEPAYRPRIERFTRQHNYLQRLDIKSVYVNDPTNPKTALASSESVKLSRNNPVGQRDGFLALTLTMSEQGWLVTDIHYQNEVIAEGELKRFLEANPKAIELLRREPNSATDVRLYPIQDLPLWSKDGISQHVDLLIHYLEARVDSTKNGGDKIGSYDAGRGVLVVRGDARKHKQIAQLLTELRASSGQPADDLAKGQPLKTYSIADLPIWSKDGKKQSVDLLLSYLRSNVDPPSWESKATRAAYNAGTLTLVVQGTEEVHRGIKAALSWFKAASVIEKPLARQYGRPVVEAYVVAALAGRVDEAGLVGAAPQQLADGPTKTGQKSVAAFNDASKSVAVVKANDAPIAAPNAVAAPKPDELFAVRGRVVDPEGKPVSGARLYLVGGREPQPDEKAHSKTDENGEFLFQMQRREFGMIDSRNPLLFAKILAVAEGYGVDFQAACSFEATGKLMSDIAAPTVPSGDKWDRTLRLVRDDVPIEGTVKDVNGKPVQGATVRAREIWIPKAKDLTSWVEAVEKGEDYDVVRDRVMNIIGGVPEEAMPAVITKADGTFRLRGGIGRERIARLDIAAPGIVSERVYVRTRPGVMYNVPHVLEGPRAGTFRFFGSTFDYTGKPSASIEGVVRDKDGGKPIGGVSIRFEAGHLDQNLMMEFDRSAVRTTTDELGKFRLTGAPLGNAHSILAIPSGQPYLPVRKRLASQPLTVVNFELTKGIKIEGRITDAATGAPVEAQLTYFLPKENPLYGSVKDFENATIVPWGKPYKTNEQGEYANVGLPGRGYLSVLAVSFRKYPKGEGPAETKEKHPGWPMQYLPALPTSCLPANFNYVAEIEIPENVESFKFDITLDSGKRLEGTLLDPEGRPLAGAIYIGLTEIGGPYLPLATPRFTVGSYNPEKPRQVFFVHQGRKLAGGQLVKGEQTRPITVTLEPWGTVSGRIVDGQGKPLAKALIRGCAPSYPNQPGRGELPERHYMADDQGRFHIEGFVPGLKYDLDLIVDGEIIRTSTGDFELKPGEIRDLGDVKIRPDMPPRTFGSLSGVRAYAQDLQETEKSGWLPTLAEANALLQKQEWVLVDGKETDPIPNPRFAFPKKGTRIGETRLKIGDAFQLTGALADGKSYNLEKDIKARGTLVLFLSSSCGACLAELPLEKAYYVKYRERGLRVVCVNVWDDPKAAIDTIEKHKIPWDVVVDGIGRKIEENVKIDSLPLILLLNGELQIVNATHTGEFALRSRTISAPIVHTSNTIQSLEKLLPQDACAK